MAGDAGAIVFLVFVVLLVLGLVYVYRSIDKGSWACLQDPGGRDEAKKKRKNDYDSLSEYDTEESDEHSSTPRKKRLSHGSQTGAGISAYFAQSAYGDTGAYAPTKSELGRLKFDVGYLQERSHLKVHVIEAKNLPPAEHGGALSFRIHTTLLPKKKAQQFRTKPKTIDFPKFGETFLFTDVPKNELTTTTVGFRLCDATGSEKVLGEAFFHLSNIAQMNENAVFQGIWRSFHAIAAESYKSNQYR